MNTLLAALLVLSSTTHGLSQQASKSISVVPKDGPLQGQTVYTDSWALFVGIGTYQNPNIPQIPPAPNDAQTMRNVLVSKYGFNPDHVEVLTDAQATRAGIEEAVSHLSDTGKVKPSDRVFVFFSGHGQGLTLRDGSGVGYLIPYDATIDLGDISNPSKYQTSCLDMEDIVKRLGASPANHRTLVVDACFSGFAVGNKALAGTTFSSDALKRMLDLPGLYVMTAGTSKDEAAAEGTATGLSLYTRALVDSLNEGTINGGTFTVDQLAAEAKIKTVSRSDGKQTPQAGQKAGSGQMLLFATETNLKPTPHSLQADPPQTEAILTLNVTPEDAIIEVDGRLSGSRATIPTDPGNAKTVTIRVSKSGFNSQVVQVEVSPGKTTPLTVTLEAVPTDIGGTTAGLGVGSHKSSAKGDVELLFVPAGTFKMGEYQHDNTGPIRSVYVDAYWIGKNDVTVAQFRTFCYESGYKFNWDANKPDWGWKDDHPMDHVNWDDARAYCQWAGGDLPTEAQWEKAARGEDGRMFPWGEEWNPDKLRCCRLSGLVTTGADSTAPVGSYPSGASPCGCLDMVGNVWQWCLDWYDAKYDAAATRNPMGPGHGHSRVLRGGAWSLHEPYDFHCAGRFFLDPTARYSNSGFRLALKP